MKIFKIWKYILKKYQGTKSIILSYFCKENIFIYGLLVATKQKFIRMYITSQFARSRRFVTSWRLFANIKYIYIFKVIIPGLFLLLVFSIPIINNSEIPYCIMSSNKYNIMFVVYLFLCRCKNRYNNNCGPTVWYFFYSNYFSVKRDSKKYKIIK